MSNYILGSLKITWRWKRWKRDWVVVGNWQLLRVGVNGSPGGFAHLIPVSWLISCILVGSCSGCSWLPWLRTPWENGPLRGSKLENVGNEWLWCFKMLKNGWSVFVSLTQAMTCWLLTSVDPWSHEAMKPWSHDAWASRSPLHVASLVVRTVEGGSTCRRQTGMIQNGWQPVRMTDIHGYPDRNLTKSRSTQCHNLGSQFFLSTQYQAPSRIMLNPRSKQRSMERTHRPWVKSHGLVAVQVDMRKWPIRRKKGW